jgi:metallo-beta-lactamase family protein
MVEGGRVLHHLIAYGSDPRNAVVLTGFQAGGTRGAALLQGERVLRIFGRDVPIRASVSVLESLSARGEPDSSEALHVQIQRRLHWFRAIRSEHQWAS